MSKMKEEFIRLQETPIMDACPDCEGDGIVAVEVAMPHSPSRDIGELYEEMHHCEMCDGLGEVERLCDCGEPVTLIMGQDAEVCDGCANE